MGRARCDAVSLQSHCSLTGHLIAACAPHPRHDLPISGVQAWSYGSVSLRNPSGASCSRTIVCSRANQPCTSLPERPLLQSVQRPRFLRERKSEREQCLVVPSLRSRPGVLAPHAQETALRQAVEAHKTRVVDASVSSSVDNRSTQGCAHKSLQHMLIGVTRTVTTIVMQRGLGVDRHLFALKCLASRDKVRRNDASVSAHRTNRPSRSRFICH